VIHSQAPSAPRDAGRGTNGEKKKRELFYKTQLMCNDRKGWGEKSSSQDFGEQCGVKKRKKGRKTDEHG